MRQRDRPGSIKEHEGGPAHCAPSVWLPDTSHTLSLSLSRSILLVAQCGVTVSGRKTQNFKSKYCKNVIL